MKGSVGLIVLNLLEVEGLDQGEELIHCLLQAVVNQSISEEHRVVCQLNLSDGELNSLFEFLFSFNSVTDSLSQLLEGRRVDEQEVTLQARLVDVNGSRRIHFDDGDAAGVVDALQLLLAGAVEVAVDLAVLHEVFVLNFLLELFTANQIVVISRLDHFLRGTGRVAHLLLEDALVLLENLLDQSVLADTRWANQDEGLSAEGRRVVGMEVLLGVDEDIIL
mmetsp:Transcript_13155/g.20455  ORF Transcript_13155/g.20455 Transcript_13155/m.20455 type:complete len:221 (+) Transcript_13155:92-754(+)